MRPNKPTRWIFLRGLAREAGHWSGFVEEFEAGIPGAHVLCLDLPGAGRRVQELSPLSIEGITSRVRAEFLEKTREDMPTYLFAISLGGMVGLDWISRFPQDFLGSVLVNTSFRGWSPFYKRLSITAYPHIFGAALARTPEARETHVLRMVSNMPERLAELSQSWGALHRERPISPQNFFRQLIAAARYTPPGEKPQVPILLLNSLADRMVDPSCSEGIEKKWGCSFFRHDTAGHDLTLDAGDWCITHVRQWLKSI